MIQERPVWDRGDAIDEEMLAFTVGEDWREDRRLVPHELAGSRVHAAALVRAGIVSAEDGEKIRAGLDELERGWRAGEWTVEPYDEDVHSAVERRLTALIGEPGKRLHTGRSRNEQVALDIALWLRAAVAESTQGVHELVQACAAFKGQHGELPLPGYTHLRRAMPSSLADWIDAHARALALDREELEHALRRARECPLGSGAGYGVPLELDRAWEARELGFEAPLTPVTAVQHARGRAELAYLTALEALALDLGKLAVDLWLFTSEEFAFLRLAPEFTTGSSLMPQKRNPDALELTRARARLIVCERAQLVELLRDLPSGYHRDFQLLKGPLFRAHDSMKAMLSLWPRLFAALRPDEPRLRAAAADPKLRSTERVLGAARDGVPFRDAYRAESRALTLEPAPRAEPAPALLCGIEERP
jgi:argininosuccinate lyase